MKKLLSLALALVLVTACASGALAETAVESFVYMYNSFLPNMFEVLEIDDSDGSLEEMLRLTYNAEMSQSLEMPSYSSSTNIYHVFFVDEDDPHSGFAFGVNSEDSGVVGAVFKIFIIYFSLGREDMELDDINTLIHWSAGGYLQDPEIECAGYRVNAEVEDGITLITVQ